MPLDTYEAVIDGECDFCHAEFEAGELVAQPNGDEVMCPGCIVQHWVLEAS